MGGESESVSNCFFETINLVKAVNLWFHAQIGIDPAGLVGLLGFEPRTKGFTLPKRFRSAWTISSPSSCLTNNPVGCGTL